LTLKPLEIFLTSGLDRLSGYVDVYLYETVKKLGLDYRNVDIGGGWCNINFQMGDRDEFLIKYAYGYHQTKYGELFLQQAKLTKSQFIERTLEQLKDWLDGYYGDNFPNWAEDIILPQSEWQRNGVSLPMDRMDSSTIDSVTIKGSIRRLDFDKCAVLDINHESPEHDRLIIYTNEISEFLKKYDIIIPAKVIADVISKNLVNIIGRDTMETHYISGSELIITPKLV
jgi:hypothetical protein